MAQAPQKQDIRVYLEEKVFPILTNGLEELLRAVEEREKKVKEEEDVPEISPLFFLARYLMKHSPTATQKNEKKEEAARLRSMNEEEQTEEEKQNTESDHSESSKSSDEEENKDKDSSHESEEDRPHSSHSSHSPSETQD